MHKKWWLILDVSIFFSSSTLFSCFEQIFWRSFSSSGIFFSDLHLFLLRFLCIDAFYDDGVTATAIGICKHPKFSMRAWVKDDFTKVHPSNFEKRLQTLIHGKMYSCKSPIGFWARDSRKVIEAQCWFQSFCYWYNLSCKKWDRWGVAAFLFQVEIKI